LTANRITFRRSFRWTGDRSFPGGSGGKSGIYQAKPSGNRAIAGADIFDFASNRSNDIGW
jgi:hypothetical protein